MTWCRRLVSGVLALGLLSPAAAAQELQIVRLRGSAYELGWQHGAQLRDEVRAMTARLLGYFRRYPKLPLVGPIAVNWWLDRSWRQSMRFLPADYQEELRGLADGSGVGLRELWRAHAIPDRTYSCSGFAAWGRATSDGRLIHTRNLDWNIEAGIQDYARVFVVEPQGRQAFLSAGWAGFIGVLTGVNQAQLSIGQVGAETDDLTYAGLPMPFLMRRILEEASDVDAAVQIVREAPRTVGINYLIADAKARRAVVVETTRSNVAVFEANDSKEGAVDYARPMADVVFRADTAMDPDIRNRQIASGGRPGAPGLEPPTGSAYEVRYLGQAAALASGYGAIDIAAARQIAASVAPPSNVQSVVFAWPEVWVANADGATPAARTLSRRLDAAELLPAATPR